MRERIQNSLVFLNKFDFGLLRASLLDLIKYLCSERKQRENKKMDRWKVNIKL